MDGPEGVRVALVRLVEQTVALGGVVAHAGQGAADLAHGFVVEVGAATAALHEPAGLAEPGGGLVEVGLPALAVALGEVVQLEILYAALQAVERVTGKGVGTRGGDPAEGSGGDSDAQ